MYAFTKKELYICGAILLFLLVAPFVFANFKLQLAFMLILIVLAMTWNIQGGEMGYNSFGNGGAVIPCPAPINSIPPANSPDAIPIPKVQIAK